MYGNPQLNKNQQDFIPFKVLNYNSKFYMKYPNVYIHLMHVILGNQLELRKVLDFPVMTSFKSYSPTGAAVAAALTSAL